jgi:peptide deformylase
MGLDDVQQPINEQLIDQPEKKIDPAHDDLKSHTDEILKTKLLAAQFPLSTKAKSDIEKLEQVFQDLSSGNQNKQQVRAVGLAANQLGLTTNACIVWLGKPTLMINPQIVGHSKSRNTKPEMCFSIPAVVIRVSRWKEISVQYQDVDGIDHVRYLNIPKLARRVQHEIDHLHGILISDYLSQTNPPVLTDKVGEA